MFLPTNKADEEKEQIEESKRKEAYARIETWVKRKIPENLINDVTVNIQEVQCGDPNCSP